MKTTISGIVAAKNGITLYMADGSTKQLSQDGWGTRAIVEAITPGLAEFGSAEIDLDQFSLKGAISNLTSDKIKVDVAADNTSSITVAGKTFKDGGALSRHIEDAAQSNDARGFKRFMEKFAAIKRSLRADELLEFMKKGDLPIADDGCIIGYKILRHDPGEVEGEFAVDCYSGRVKQRVGSLVYMPGSKIDDGNRQACSSNGLHVCSFGYIRDFSGSVIMLVKVQPGDVISVPHNENTKMRAAAYQICLRIPDDVARGLRNGIPFDKIEGGPALLEKVIVGNHSPIIERVAVQHNSGKVTVELVKVKAPPAGKRKKVRTLKSKRSVMRGVDPKAIKKTARLIKSKLTKIQADKLSYDVKLARAQKLFDTGYSIRDIAPMLHMDRESLGRNLKR